MNEPAIIAAAVALAFTIAAPAGIAQTLTHSAPILRADYAVRSSHLIGMNVSNDQGQSIRTVNDILLKNRASEPIMILPLGESVGGDAKLVAVPLDQMRLHGSKAMMPGATKQMLARMAAYRFDGLLGGG
jgi:hypothetical protein